LVSGSKQRVVSTEIEIVSVIGGGGGLHFTSVEAAGTGRTGALRGSGDLQYPVE
jgi:hypothetical protein